MLSISNMFGPLSIADNNMSLSATLVSEIEFEHIFSVIRVLVWLEEL
jgi:hypothetical protein